MVRTDDTIFSALNGLSEKQGTQLIRFTEKQAADNVDISIQTATSCLMLLLHARVKFVVKITPRK